MRGDLLRRGLHREEVGFHFPPVIVLIVRGAVREERREGRLRLPVVPAKDVELQLVEEHGALPVLVRGGPFRQELTDDRRDGGERQSVAKHERPESQVIGAAERQRVLRMFGDVLSHESKERLQRVGGRDFRRPGIRHHETVDRLAVRHVHASADPHRQSRLGHDVPHAFRLELRALVELGDPVVLIIQARVHRDPLHPGVQLPAALRGFGDVNLRLAAQPTEVGQVSLPHEPIHQLGRKLVEFQQHHALRGLHEFSWADTASPGSATRCRAVP